MRQKKKKLAIECRRSTSESTSEEMVKKKVKTNERKDLTKYKGALTVEVHSNRTKTTRDEGCALASPIDPSQPNNRGNDKANAYYKIKSL